MRRFISFLVLMLVCVSVNAIERKEIALDSIQIKIVCSIEEPHSIYGAADAVAKTTPPDCSQLHGFNKITVEQGRLSIYNTGTGYKETYTITSCVYDEGKVFADRGFEEVYSFQCKDEKDIISQITYEKVSNEGQTYNIVTVQSYDNRGCLYMVTTYR